MPRLISVFKLLNPRQLWSHKKLLIALIVIIAILGFFLWPRQKAEPLQFTQAKRHDIASSVSASGNLDGKNSVNLHFRSAGKLAYLNVKAGERVSSGQNIAGLDIQDLATSLKQAQNNLRDKQIALEKTLDDIHLSQYGSGGFSNVGTANETETQKQLRTAAEVAKDNAADSLKAAQRAFQDVVIFSPIEGLVTQANLLPGQNLTAADTVAQIVDDTQIRFDADIDEAEISKISLNQPVNVTLNAYPNQTFNGVVEEITPLTKSTASGATVVTVKIKLLQPPTNLVVGLNGQASIITSQAKNVITIPQEALRDDGTVMVHENGGFSPIKVKTGITSDSDVEIAEGLKEGDEVVLNPSALPSSRPNSNPLTQFLRLGGGPGRGR